jgi:type VI secretion system protein ImpG
VTFGALDLTTLRLHLNGESNLTSALYELLDRNSPAIVVRETGTAAPKSVVLPAGSLRVAGFGAEEGLLPYPGRSFQAYRLLQEYFAFPEKYLFFDLDGFDLVRQAEMGGAIEVLVPIAPFERAEWRPVLEAGVGRTTFRLGCTPIINLFPHVSEPVLLTQRRHEYPLVADVRRRTTTQIFSIDSVTVVVPDADRPLRLQPFYAPRTGAGARPARGGDDEIGGVHWLTRRREGTWRAEHGAEVNISFVDRTGRASHPDYDALTARLTCFNGDLPSRLPFGDEHGDFELEAGGPVREIVALLKPTRVIESPLADSLSWRLISQLSLNYLSLVDGGVDALRDLLRLHDFADSAATRRQIAGVTAVRSGPAFARIATEHGLTFARGRRVELDFDEEEFTGGGVYLFANVLERFLGLYVSINSFSVLSARTRQRKSVVREWPPRAGWKPLL